MLKYINTWYLIIKTYCLVFRTLGPCCSRYHCRGDSQQLWRERHPHGEPHKPQHHPGAGVQASEPGHLQEPRSAETAATPAAAAGTGPQERPHQTNGVPTAHPGRAHQHQGPRLPRAVLRHRGHDWLVFNSLFLCEGARCSSVVRAFTHGVRWVVGSILHGVDPLSYFSFQPVLQDRCNKGCGMYYPVCGMMYIKEPLLLIGKSSPMAAAGFLSCYLSGPLPYVWRHITVNKMCWVCR